MYGTERGAAWVESSYKEDLRRQRWRHRFALVTHVCCCCCKTCCHEPTIPLCRLRLSKLQKERLYDLRRRAETGFDRELTEHKNLLRSLAVATFGESFTASGAQDESDEDDRDPRAKARQEEEFEDSIFISDKWKSIGFQSRDPSTDFRAGIGILSIQNLIYFVHTNLVAFQRIINYMEGSDLQHFFPFALVGINLTFKLVELLSINRSFSDFLTVTEAKVMRKFLYLLEIDQYAFEEIYSSCFMALFEIWCKEKWKYLDFQKLMQRVMNMIRCVLIYKQFASIREFVAHFADWEQLKEEFELE